MGALSFFWIVLQLAAVLCTRALVGGEKRERIALSLAAFPVVTLGLWVSLVWALSFVQGMSRWSLLGGVVVIGATLTAWKWRDVTSMVGELRAVGGARLVRGLLPFSPLLPLGAFQLWKGFVLPTSNPDALFLHLPRAIFISRAGGLSLGGAGDVEWASLVSYPLNYEGILASILSISGSAACTEWFTAWTSCLFILFTIGMTATLWPSSDAWQLAGMALVLAGTPVLLLHGATDKVDVATGVCAAATLFWGHRLLQNGNERDLIMAWMAAFLTMGFKKSGLLFFAICLAMTGIAAVRKSGLVRLRSAVSLASLFVWLGGAGWVGNWLSFGRVLGADGEVASYVRPVGAGLFEPTQLLTYPVLLNLVPFSSRSDAVYVPWRGEWWYWPSTNLFFSHWGWLLNGLVLVSLLSLPWVAWRSFRGDARSALLLIATGAYLVVVCKSYAYDGGFNSFPRYTLFFAPFLGCFFVIPGIRALVGGRPGAPQAMWLVAVGVLAGSAHHYALVDHYTPLSEVWRRWEEPELRRVIPAGPRRVPCLLDREAGPSDVIATDLTYMTWLTPLFGEELGRTVHVLRMDESGDFHVPDDSLWVIADNVATSIWGLDKTPRTAAEQLRAFNTGRPSERDTRLYRQLLSDPRFDLVYVAREGAEVVFRRR